ncbi:hypothetical protein [Kitasatospora sp. NPDC092286]|uniref:hypothetical protein n=1 Tax=Kitasatospora sp. NPDC092286 TaxID=3364087 RepID=UPI003830F7A3
MNADESFWLPVPDVWNLPEVPTAGPVPPVHREPIHRLSEVRPLRGLSPHTRPATNGATR